MHQHMGESQAATDKMHSISLEGDETSNSGNPFQTYERREGDW